MYKLVSIIVPVFKVDTALLTECVNSIIKQTYPNIEILLIDDGNESEYKKTLVDFEKIDNRIKVISHKENQGLYRARLTGIDNSKGEYIAFVDADDAITVDWIRLLVKKADITGAEIVMGRTICKDENGWKYVFNSNVSGCTREDICGENVFAFLMKDAGLDFSIHTMWNKIYRKELWERAYDDLNKISNHLVMTEDILFSSILFYHAKKMSFSNTDGYIYYRNSSSSTLQKNDCKKCTKNIQDICLVFNSISAFLQTQGAYEKYKKYFLAMKDRYFRWWSSTVQSVCENSENSNEVTKLKKLFFDGFAKTDFEQCVHADGYFEERKTSWNDKLELIKEEVIKDKYKAVSFDLFDTLITRPFLYPEDLYLLVLSEVDILPYSAKTMNKYRKLSEEYARRNIKNKFPQYEDINIEEIYEAMHSHFNIPSSLCEELKNKECELEVEFAKRRTCIYDIYELAVLYNKKIYITSDMYLDSDTIKKILTKCGYTKYERLLLSSSERLLKNTGNLFVMLEEQAKCKPSEIIHMGDNWNSDYTVSMQKGMRSFFIPKTKDILFNYLGDKYTGDSIGKTLNDSLGIIDYSKFFDSFSNRCLYAVAANKLCDNPFISFNSCSDFNGDPYFLGTFAYGIHVFGISMWLYDLVKKCHYQTLHFSSRDGFYLKKVFDLISEKLNDNTVNTNYFYISRKSMIPIEVQSRDFVDNIISSCSFSNNSPRSIIKRYSSVLAPLTDEIEQSYKKNGFILDSKFKNEDEMAVFLQILKNVQFDETKAEQEQKICKEYFIDTAKIGSADLVFDLGYSGKLHNSIVKCIGKNVDGAYLSKDGYDAQKLLDDNNLNVVSYYDFTPSMQGIINEYIFSERGPSCIGYVKTNGSVTPVFDEVLDDFIGDYVVNELNRGAYKFISEVLDIFHTRICKLKTRALDSSILYENFLIHHTDFDISIFDDCYVEDEYYGGIDKMQLRSIWYWQINDRKLNTKRTDTSNVAEVTNNSLSVSDFSNPEYEVYKNKIAKRNMLIKALYWLCVDKKYFFKRIKERMGGKSERNQAVENH